MRIKDMKKFIRSILIALGVVVILLLMLTYPPALSHEDVTYKTITVSSGDTLWKIAEDLQSNNNYYKGKDVRYIIDDLVNVNHLDSKTLIVNQKLQVPIY